jgi:L-fuconolactonase
MVLDHIAKPVIDGGGVDADWRTGIERLAAMPNVCCKFSGAATEVVAETWDLETLRPYWDVVLEAFTPDRLMFGSDWPVCLLRTGYGRWLDTVRRLAEPLSADEQEQLFSSTAKRVYDLE